MQSHLGDWIAAIVATRAKPNVAGRLSKFDVPYTRAIESTFLRDLLSWVIPALVLFGLRFFVARKPAEKQGGLGGFMSIGKSRATIYVQRNTGVTFADVAGVDETKAGLREVVEFLGDPQRHGRPGARLPDGALPVGPPDTGRALLTNDVLAGTT